MPIATDTKKRIANFEIIELIGSGGMANIYKATQLSLDRPVALKVLHRHLTLNENFVTRFEKEAKRAATLHQENIVSIIDYGSFEGEYFIAMEYIEGQNLKQMMTRMKRLPLEVALLIGKEIATGLKYAHSNGLIHRDIKPANIMLSSDGRILITDFGISKNHADLSITDTGQMVGSPAYMSPEQAAGRPIDHRCDIFSLGIVLYEIIIGERPFKGDTYQEMVTNIISAPIPNPSQLRVDVTPTLEEVIKKCLRKDIEGRYQDAELLVADLDNELKDFIIQSPRKLMMEFTKNPIRTTEKLRSERIAKHTEKALYLMNLGHGRLADATREFESVLRFDKSNKLAKSYLEKLRSGQIAVDSEMKPGGKKNRLWLKTVVGTALLMALLVIYALIAVFVRKDHLAISVKKSSQTTESANSANSLPAKQNEFLQSNSDKANKSIPSKESQNNAKASETKVAKPVPAKSSIAAKSGADIIESHSQPTTFDYPDQDLAQFGWVSIISTPQGIFSVDFKEYGKTNGPPVKLAPGRHLITIKLDSYRTFEKRIYVENGKTLKVEAKLTAER